MDEALVSIVGPAATGHALLDWLVRRFTYLDESGWRTQLAAGRVHRNEAVARGDERLVAGDRISFAPPEADGAAASRVPVLFEDEHLVAVDKPPHLVVQRVGAFAHNTFAPALARRFPAESGFRLEPVHRLDRETSGVLLFARTRTAFRGLQAQFEARAVAKRYVAVVAGRVADETMRIDGAIGPASDSVVAVRRAVVAAEAPGARRAVTDVTVLRRLVDCTLVRAEPRTGRTHQLRVHLAHAGHAIVGDKLYGQSEERYLAYVAHLKANGDPRWPGQMPVGRQLLHAEALEFLHPTTGAPVRLSAPWPQDLEDHLAAAAT